MQQLQDFFSLEQLEQYSFFEPEAVPWQPLDALQEYMDGFAYPRYDFHVVSVPIRNGIPLNEPVIIHNNKALCFNDLEIDFGDTCKGELEVRRAGMPLAGASVIMAGAVLVGDQISIGKGVLIESGAMLKGPIIIGDHSEVRQGAYLRGHCLVGSRCVVGHTTEVKNSIFLDDAKAGHFAYIGDSILGAKVNLGAGTKLANLKFLSGNVCVDWDGDKRDSGRRKLGAILGDGCQTGCNSVTSPGTVMGKKAMLLPNTTAEGKFYKAKAIIR